jgi:hypothetical protein
MSPYIEQPICEIQSLRSSYCSDAKMSKYDAGNYMRDWVANYEIEDYLRESVRRYQNGNVYFFRQVAYDHPDLMKGIKN